MRVQPIFSSASNTTATPTLRPADCYHHAVPSSDVNASTVEAPTFTSASKHDWNAKSMAAPNEALRQTPITFNHRVAPPSQKGNQNGTSTTANRPVRQYPQGAHTVLTEYGSMNISRELIGAGASTTVLMIAGYIILRKQKKKIKPA